ncbi:WD repeat-containing protein 55 [Thecamonas trahens ATCC 50062]|uniref:WD repeat-containing protein 55 n=1 Tax=Thecamonas trahens ATCC 50062 TaxID=461836 RepID=A0A0L0DT26_THETB|nr:WD repeat-containing protein 55 [Thecamonas trahens ATCC 50062]KNC55186.1 WD repeat-containing protein 55 [Thecamonas trahens ATCC 50062]|eukprot:XP_013753238.1 WD repeat-containing protein 55 [Thecamonas trahens ATCC 50062]
MATYTTPGAIELPALGMNLHFHPSNYVLAAGCVDGALNMYSLSETAEAKLMYTVPYSDGSSSSAVGQKAGSTFSAISARAIKSLRAAAFSPSGNAIFLGHASGTLKAVDVETGKGVWTIPNATQPSLARRWRKAAGAAAETARALASDSAAAAALAAEAARGPDESVAGALAAIRRSGKKGGKKKKGGMASRGFDFYLGGEGQDGGEEDDDEFGGDVATPINALLALGEFGLASGDDTGTIRIWDVRAPNYVRTSDMHEDYVTSFTSLNDGSMLISSGGDGRIGAFDLAGNRPLSQSEPLDDEIVSVTALADGSKVVAGVQTGELHVFEAGYLGAPLDEYAALGSIEAMVKISEGGVALAAADGSVRVFSVHPNKLVDVVSEHDVEVSAMAVSGDGLLLASTGHDTVIRFTNLTTVHDKIFQAHSHERMPRRNVVLQSTSEKPNSFFDDL